MAGPPKRLSIVSPQKERLGAETIMDKTLAAQHGIPYVHLVAFAVDTDRIREALEQEDDGDDMLPFGWEIFLTAHYIRTRFEASSEGHRVLLEDAVLSVLDRVKARTPPLGAQLAFAVYDLVRRGFLHEELAVLFDAWKKKPDKALDALDGLWDDAAESAGVLAHACLQVELAPPPAPPTMEAWGAMVLAGRVA